jgi:hypothetical protein
MDFDLNSRFSRLEKDQAKRREEAKRKLYQEKKARDEQAVREQKLAEEAQLRKIEEERREEERLAQELLDQQETAGIKVSARKLVPYEIEGGDDKIILPENLLNELTAQDAFSLGPMFFRITASSKNRQTAEIIQKISHCGVREFTAEASHVGLPRKVLDSLLPSEDHDIFEVEVKYIRLPKTSYVKLQPKANDFFSVGPVKQCLEENLRTHSTLTVNDILTVWYRGKAHVLKVVDMKPELRGSLVDSDVEVDLELSEEYQKLQQPADSAAIASSSADLPMESSVKFHRLNEPVSSSASSSSSAAAQPAYELPVEPGPSAQSIAIKVKTPNSGTLSRRFLSSHGVSSLFHYVSQATNRDVRQLQLSTRFPPRTLKYNDVVTEENQMTYESLGLQPQETFMAQFI